MKRNVAKITKAITVALWVSCVVLSCILFSSVWGKYFTQGEGSDGGRVARFDVSASFTGASLDFMLSEDAGTATYPFSVTSNSEVAVAYDVVLTLPSALSGGVSFAIGSVAPTANGLVYTFSNVGTIQAGGGTNTHELVITATDFSEDATISGVQVEIVATQID